MAVQPIHPVYVRTASGWQQLAYMGPRGTVGPFREGHTFAVLGDLGALVELPSFFVPRHPGQVVLLAGLHGRVAAGNVTIHIRRNGEDVGPGVPLDTEARYTGLGGIPLADGDEIGAALSGHAGPPNTLSATVALEWSVP